MLPERTTSRVVVDQIAVRAHEPAQSPDRVNKKPHEGDLTGAICWHKSDSHTNSISSGFRTPTTHVGDETIPRLLWAGRVLSHSSALSREAVSDWPCGISGHIVEIGAEQRRFQRAASRVHRSRRTTARIDRPQAAAQPLRIRVTMARTISATSDPYDKPAHRSGLARFRNKRPDKPAHRSGSHDSATRDPYDKPAHRFRDKRPVRQAGASIWLA